HRSRGTGSGRVRTPPPRRPPAAGRHGGGIERVPRRGARLLDKAARGRSPIVVAEETEGIDRREFLRRGALLGVGVGLAPGVVLAATDTEPPGPPRIRAQRTLGRTGLQVSDIAFGSSRLGEHEDDLVRHAFDAGVNYFDTAEDYTGGAAETAIGKALEKVRDRCILASKVEASASGRRGDFMRALEGSLRRLRTDHVDVYFNHAVNDVARMK